MFLRPGAIDQSHIAAFGIALAEDTNSSDRRIRELPVEQQQQQNNTQNTKHLPIYEHRTQILYLVEHHATTIITGETGSGKTTQIPQYLHQAGWCSNENSAQLSIVCTQPRRVAAMTVAARVAEEMGCRVGQEVGYAVRFEDVSTPGVTRIKFCTDEVLLRDMMEDPLLTKYSVVMVDEAHERTLASDVLLGLLKKVQRHRPDLRIIVSSATLQAEHIAEFFASSTSTPATTTTHTNNDSFRRRQPALLSVEGRPHSVQMHYLEEPTSDYVRAAVEAAVSIHVQDLPGDILIFLTGQEECQRAAAWLREEEATLLAATPSHRKRDRKRLVPCTLYAGMPAAAQLAVFEPPARNTRRVVVATNAAETSVTIQGIVYVIDCMYSRQRCYDPLSGVESLLVAPCSRASAAQRAGRAGRIRPGHCFRLCTEADYESNSVLRDVEVPQMQRCELSSTVLQLKSLGIDNMMTFHWLAPPPAEAMVRALETLHALGAIGDDARLTTPLGVRMSEVPLDPQMARALLAGAERGCAVEVATVVAMLSVESVWAHAESKVMDAAKRRFSVAQGDLVTYLNVWRGWEESGGRNSKRWCYANCVNHRSMLRVADVRVQLLTHLRRLRVPLNASSSSDTTPITTTVVERLLKAFTAGLFMNAARLVSDDGDEYALVRGGPGSAAAAVKLRIHSSSVLFRCRPQWVCFVTALQTDSGWYEMQDVLAVESASWLTEAAPHYYSAAAGGGF